MPDNDTYPHVTPEQILNTLREQFPLAFPTPPQAVRPLKRGIREDLLRALRETFPQPTLLKALAGYVNSPLYQAAVAQGGERVDLAGNPNGSVQEKHQAYATQWLVGWQQRQQVKAERRQAHEETLHQQVEQKAKRQRAQEQSQRKPAKPFPEPDPLAPSMLTPPQVQSIAPSTTPVPTTPSTAHTKPQSGSTATPIVSVTVKKRRTLPPHPK